MPLLKRIKTAWDKFIFCYRITSDWQSFIHMIINTKKYSTQRNIATSENNAALSYKICVNGNNYSIYLRTHTGDINVFYEVFWENIYTHPQVEWEKINTVVDLGAHVGLASIFFLSRQPATTVYSVEADKDNFTILEKNLRSDDLKRRSFVINAAISDSNGKVFLQKQRQSYNSAVSKQPTEWEIESLNIERLIDEYEIEKIDLLKIDIEGWEIVLLQGDTSWLKRVRYIVMECHSQEIRQTCERILRENQFDISPAYKNIEYLDLLWAQRR